MKNSPKSHWENQLLPLWPCLKGSLAKVNKPCIRPNCQVCQEGKKHPAWILSYSQGGRRRCLYVPLEMVKTLKTALKNGRRLEQLLYKMGPLLVQEYRNSLKSKPKKQNKC